MTGQRYLSDPLFGNVSVLLHDGAEAVPVVSRDDRASLVSYRSGREAYTMVITFVCCGPEATLPQAYGEHVERQSNDVDLYVFTLGELQWRQAVSRSMAPHEAEVWRVLRQDFARVVDEGEGMA